VDPDAFAAFIFDVDGTLIDSEKYHLRALAGAMKEIAGYELTPRDAKEFSGNTSLWLADRIARREGLDIDPQQVAARKFDILYQDFHTELFPGAAEFVQRWAGVKPIGLASNSPLHFVQKALEDVSLFRCFDAVVTIDDVRRKKPAPDMILLCAERLGVPARQILVFEDTALGVEAARAAGCRAVLVDNPGLGIPADLPPGVPVLTWPELCLHSAPTTATQQQIGIH
jgi:HAD superfamily hydrolase (TIGR01509 family)